MLLKSNRSKGALKRSPFTPTEHPLVRRAAQQVIEPLEERLFLSVSATLTPPATVTSGISVALVVTYTDSSATPIDQTTEGTGNITVIGPGPGNANTLTIARESSTSAANSPTAIVTYVANAPGNTSWSAADNGTYTVGVTNQVKDTGGTAVAANSNIGTFTVNVGDTAPSASLTSAPTVSTTGSNPEKVVITYTDNDSTVVKGASVATNNITVTGPAGALTVSGVNTVSDAATAVATYTVNAPTGGWTSAADGTYTIALANTVTDTSGNAVTANPNFGNFQVNVGNAPVPSLTSAPDVTAAGGTTEPVVITWIDNSPPVKNSSLATSNITVTGPTGTALTISGIANASSSDGPTQVVTYTVKAPGGNPWSASDNGTYTIGTTNTVTSTTGTASVPNANLGTFLVNVSSGLTATLTAAPPVTTAGGTSENIVITYTSSGNPIKGASLGTNNITVTGPTGTALTVSSITPATNTDGPSKVVTYTVAAPGGSWSASNAGVYTIGLANTVTDTAGNPITANPNFGTFAVQLGDKPFATLTTPTDITTGTSTTEPIVIVYSDPGPSLVTQSSIVPGNITVTGPGSSTLTVASVSTTPTSNAATITATYVVTAPGGTTWNSADNGTYTIALNGTVTNTAGTAITPVPNLGTFAVSVGVVSRPTPTLTPPATISTATSSPEPIVITWVDQSSPINVTTLGTGNIKITDTNGVAVQVISATPDANTNGPTRIVTYQVLPTTGSWSSSDVGLYTIGVTAQVTDLAGRTAVASPAFGSFTVNISDTIPPTAAGSVSNIDFANDPSLPIVIVYSDNVAVDSSTIGVKNITVTGTNGEALSVDSISEPVGTIPNAKTITVTYNVSSPSGNDFSSADNGNYIVALNGGLGGVHDRAGNSIVPNLNFLGFTIDIQNTTRPTVAITANDVVTSGRTNIPVTAVFSDPIGINVSTIKLSDFKVVDTQGEQLQPTGLTLSTTTNAPTITASFFLLAPSGTFSQNDNGVYTISVSNVLNTSGLPLDPNQATQPFNIKVPISTSTTTIPVGQAGLVNGKYQKLRFHDTPDGTDAILTVTGGTATLYQEGGSSQLDLVVTQVGPKPMVITARTTRNGPLTFKDVIVTGDIKSFTAPTTTITGTYYEAGTLGKISFQHLIGVFAVSGPIASMTVTRAVSDSLILSGANFGTTQHLTSKATYTPGYIGTLKITGGVVRSVIAAGDNPGPDQVFGTADDFRAGAEPSRIASFTADSVDATSRIATGIFGKFKIGRQKFVPNPLADGRFIQV